MARVMCYSYGAVDYISELNEMQKDAVLHKDGPLLIVAGAGAGKTKTITHRILHLIKTGVRPQKILAITFTNKAAKEMRDRVSDLIKKDSGLNFPVSFDEQPFMSTFHSLGAHILREQSSEVGLSKQFTIFDERDTASLIKEALKNLSLDQKQWEPRRMKSMISRQKGDLLTADAYAAGVGNEYVPRVLSSVWSEYERLLSENGGVDFDDLIVRTTLLLRDNKEVRDFYKERWQYIHIDEYQDTNIAQYELSKLLAGERRNICVVGDMDQSIYSWRGADFRNIMNFENDYPDTKTVLLEENYRSTANILTAANSIIKKNKVRKEKKLFTRKEEGEKIGVFGAYDEAEEAHYVARTAKELIRLGVEPKDIAVLYRVNFQSRVLEESFLAESVPYQVLGVKFFERMEVKDMLSYLRASQNPKSLADIKRAINTPPRGVGKVTLAKIFAGQEASLPEKMRVKVADFYALLEDIRVVSGKSRVSETMKFILKKSGLENKYREGTEEDIERLENMRELVTLASKYDVFPPEEGVNMLLEESALASDQDSLGNGVKKEENAVRLMTVHASKGLEFPYVFIVGLEQDLFPHSGFSDNEAFEERAEEERRLFYVALTRAEKKARLSYAAVRTIFGMKQVNMPSEFITDIDESCLEQDCLPDSVVE